MTWEKTNRVGNLLNDENFSTVIEFATQNNMTPDVALNRIVSDWAEKDKIGRLKTPPPQDNPEYLEDRVTYLESWFSTFYDEVSELPIWNEE